MPVKRYKGLIVRRTTMDALGRERAYRYSTAIPRASIQVEYSVPPKRWAVASRAMVDFPARRQGVMTRLYELAARQACAHNRRLVSDLERSVFAEAFWRKQAAKGRARCIRRNSPPRSMNYWDGPLLDLEEHLAQRYRDPLYGEPDYERASSEVKKIVAHMPSPKRDYTQNGSYWPCQRWGLRQDLCKKPSLLSLDGW